MSKFEGIFVGGIPGGGCTLMRRLFRAFRGVYSPEMEMLPQQLVRLAESTEAILVGSRLGNCVFADDLPEEEEKKQLKVLKENNIGVLVMTRAFTDKSHITKDRWVASHNAIFKYWDSIHYILSYHRLVVEPDVVQEEIGKAFGLTAKHKFSEYPDFIDPDTLYEPKVPATMWKASHSLRRIGAPYYGSNRKKEHMNFLQMERKHQEQNGYIMPRTIEAAVETLKKSGTVFDREGNIIDDGPSLEDMAGHTLRRIGEPRSDRFQYKKRLQPGDIVEINERQEKERMVASGTD